MMAKRSRARGLLMRGTLTVSIAALAVCSAACGSSGGATGTDGTAPSGTSGGSTEQTQQASGAGTGAASENASESSNGETSELTPEKTSITLAYQAPDFAQIADFKFVDELRKKGIDVKFFNFENKDTLVRSIIAGEVDYAVSTGVDQVVQVALNTDDRLKIVAADGAANDFVLVGQPDISGLEDFANGKLQIGISTPGDQSDTLTRYILDKAGIDADKVSLVQVGGTSARMTAILNGQLDAGPAHAAEGFTAAQKGGKKVIARYADYLPGIQQHSLYATAQTIADNPNLTQIMVDTMVDATRWAASNKDDYIATAKSVLDEPPADDVMSDVYDMFTDIGLFALNGGMDEQLLNDSVSVSQSTGALPAKVPDLSEWSDASFVQNYLERNGRL